MRGTPYTKGRRLEYELRRLFEDAGWSVMRGAGSKGKVMGCNVDLVASKQTKNSSSASSAYMVLIQAKREKLTRAKGETL